MFGELAVLVFQVIDSHYTDTAAVEFEAKTYRVSG
jgi:hypothetical protein